MNFHNSVSHQVAGFVIDDFEYSNFHPDNESQVPLLPRDECYQTTMHFKHCTPVGSIFERSKLLRVVTLLLSVALFIQTVLLGLFSMKQLFGLVLSSCLDSISM